MLFCLLEFNEDISPSLSSILPFAEPIEAESPTIEAELAPTRSTKPGVFKGNMPIPNTDADKVETDDATPDILDELELILPSKLVNLAPTSTPLTVSVVPALIEARVDILYNADKFPVVIEVHLLIEPSSKSKSPKSGGLSLSVILSATISREVISILSVICTCFELISLV
jgi:hypothetical protein